MSTFSYETVALVNDGQYWQAWAYLAGTLLLCLTAVVGGLATAIPVFSTFFMIVTLSSLGLPMLNGFVGEFLIIVGAFGRSHVYGALAALGVVLAAVYLLWMYQRVFYGEVTNEKNKALPDCNLREKIMLVALAAVILLMGIYPQMFLRKLDMTATTIVQRVEPSSLAYQPARRSTAQNR